MRKRTLLSTCVLISLFCTFTQAKVIYVDDDANGVNNGSSWQNAYAYLQDAMDDAQNSEKPVEIRIAQGIYKPDLGQGITPGDRGASFKLVNDVNLVGSYAGLGESDPNARDIELYETILSGDLNGDDIEIANNQFLFYESSRADNSYTIIIGWDPIERATLDGLIITDGNANGTQSAQRCGGGIYNYYDSPKIVNCTFSKNAAYTGGGVYNYYSNPVLINCTFVQNVAENSGGAIFSEYDSNPTLTNCLFSGNIAGSNGGSISATNSTLVVTECTFRWNESRNYGGGIYYSNCDNSSISNCLFGLNLAGNYGGGLYNTSSDCNITDCTFMLNMSYYGAGVYNTSNNSIFAGCTFNSNIADNYGGGIYNIQSNASITDCIFSENYAIYGGGIYNYQESEPNIINCTFEKNTASYGAGLYNYYYGNLKIENCIFNENTANSQGGAVNNSYRSNIIVNNCAFTKNTAYSYGGGFYINQDCEPNLTNCVFEENTASRGGGIYNYYNCNTEINNCTFSKNTADSYGAGMYIYRSIPVLSNSTFNENYAERGGGIYNYYDSETILTSCTFNGNSAYLGGGLYNYRSTPELSECIFNNNSAENDGGAVYNYYDSEPKFVNCKFGKNNAYNGGGIYNYNSIPLFTNCTISGNTAAQYGGGMYNYNSTPSLKGNLFSANLAGVSGGGIYSDNSNFKITNCILTANKSLNRGGAIENYRSSNIGIINCTFVANNAAYGSTISSYSTSTSNANVIEITSCIIRDENNEIYNSYDSTINIAYSNIKGGMASVYDPGAMINWHAGNFDTDPFFANPGFWDPNGTPGNESDDFWVEGDYHLKSMIGRYDPNTESWVTDELTSLCIDTGSPASPLGHEPFPNADIINMGAYGGTIEASKSLYDVNYFQQAYDPNPSDEEEEVILDILPGWSCDANAAEYEIYFGSDEYPPFITRQEGTRFDPGALEPNTHYFWRVDEIDSLLHRVEGKKWTFLTGPHPVYAYNPSPIDGTENIEFSTLLTWNPGIDAAEHNVYFGTDFNDVYNATLENPLGTLVSIEQDPNYYNPGQFESNQTYFWRVDEVNDNDIITKGNIWTFSTGEQPSRPYNPSPANGANNVISRYTELHWSPGNDAVAYDVYFGTDSSTINQATVTNPLNVLLSQNQDPNYYSVPGLLSSGSTYYWRVDQINIDGTTIKGNIWEFTTESGGSKGRGCFIAQTPVMLSGSSISIASASIGQSIDDNSNIEEVQVHHGTYPLYDVLFESGNIITVAENHIFMTDDGKWLSLHNLKASMKLKTQKGSIEIKSITKQPDLFTGKVYNLKIKGSDQYMVGEDLIIVRDY